MSDFKIQLEQTRRKLLDLTKRNKLINYKKPTASRFIKIIDESPQFIYKHLVSDESAFRFKSVPEPKIIEIDYNKLAERKNKLEALKNNTLFDGEQQAAEKQIEKIYASLDSKATNALLTAEEQAKNLGFNISAELPIIDLAEPDVDEKYIDDYLQTLHYPSDLEKILKKIELNARNILEETGANMLYLILGILEWTESEQSEVTFKSPLINIPVSIKRGSFNRQTSTFEYILEYTGESIDTNKSLSEKLKNDFNILLPELTEELSFNEYMLEVNKICTNKKNWKIKHEISLDFLQFSKILMYKDLDTEAWGSLLEENIVLKDLFLGREMSGGSYSPGEYDIDAKPMANLIPLVLDADSSQHSAIIDVMDGKNVVIEGPPGTGKSQTISNMIAALIASGKSVLFVSEKLAALEVVHKRLSNVHLGDFCLELHSHKTQKLKILDSLKRRLEKTYKMPNELYAVRDDIDEKKNELKKYLDILHSEYGSVNKKIFEVFWLVEKYHHASKFLKYSIKEPESYSVLQLNNIIRELQTYQSNIQSYDFHNSYWYGFQPANLEIADKDIFLNYMNNFFDMYCNIADDYLALNKMLDNPIDNEVESTVNISDYIYKTQTIMNNISDSASFEPMKIDIKLLDRYIDLSKKLKNIKDDNKKTIIDYELLKNDEQHFILNCIGDNKKSLELIKESYRLQTFNEQNICDYQSLDFKQKQFLINLDKSKIEFISKTFLGSNSRYISAKSELQSILMLNVYNSDILEILSNEFTKASDILYPELTLNNLETILDINRKIDKEISSLEVALKTLLRETNMDSDFDIYSLTQLGHSIDLFMDIDLEEYVYCTTEFGTNNFRTIFARAQNEFHQISHLKKTLDEIFIIDKITVDEIDKLTLIKENIQYSKNRFFRFISPSYRKSKIIYAEMLTKPIVSDSNIWIEHLDLLIKFLSQKKQFNNNELFINYFGVLYKGCETNWALIHKINQWAQALRKTIKNDKVVNLMLSGNENIYLSIVPFINAISLNISNLKNLLIGCDRAYDYKYLKKLYNQKDDINVVNLNQQLADISLFFDGFTSKILSYSIAKDISFENIVLAINYYVNAEEDYQNNKIIAQKLLFENANTTDTEDFTSTLIDIMVFLEKQTIQFEDIVKNLSDENTNSNNINQMDYSLIELARNVYQFLYKQTKTFEHVIDQIAQETYFENQLLELKQLVLDSNSIDVGRFELSDLAQHSKLVHLTIESKMDESISSILLENFNKIYSILSSINANEVLINSQWSLISKFGIFNKKYFFGQNLNQYSQYIEKFKHLDISKKDLSTWLDFNRLILKLQNIGCTEILKSVNSGTLPKEYIVDAYYYNFYNTLLMSIFRKYPTLNNFNRLSHEELINTFKSLDLKLLNLNKELVASRASERKMPYSNGGGKVKEFTNRKLIEHEISKSKKHIPIRQLVNRASGAIQALKPCFMMSPLSVAQYLPPKELQFDVLLIDEASQLKPEEALGVIARAKQIVIVGDPKQLPPTSFFDNLINDDDDTEENTIVDEAESILDACIDLYSPIRRLKWHYRSQHETLIDFSNQQFYDNDLIVFPSPSNVSDSELGVKHTYVENAIYQSGASQRYNKVEAKVLVEHAVNQMKDYPEKTLGIGTFNKSQRDLIQQMIDDKEKQDAHVANYMMRWKESAEPFFVKNLESLQGDERDIIFISTTYGPDKLTGQVMQRFGPINQDAGWRRLNVLITRSKQKMHVFTSIKSENIKINQTSSKGVIALRGFLQFLEIGQLTIRPTITDRGFDSPFEESVYQLLSDAGIKAVPQVGVAGYFIDLAITADESNDFVLAIECDGVTYHSSKSARDRDRLKDDVLKKLGWKVYRIWSADWFKNRDNEISKLLRVISEQKAIYSEKYTNRKVVTHLEPKVNLDNNNVNILHLSNGVHLNKIDAECSDNQLNKSEYSQNYLSDEAVKSLLIEFRNETISKNFSIDRRCILSPMMIDQFIKYKPLDMDEFRNKISLKLRTNIDREQLIYMDSIFEILEMSDE